MTLHVQLVSPEQVLFEGDADMVVVRTLGGGDIAFLTGHVSFLGALDTWPLRVIQESGQVTFAVHGGFVEVSKAGLTVLAITIMTLSGIVSAYVPAVLPAARAWSKTDDALPTFAALTDGLASSVMPKVEPPATAR